jgi:hypothetical protein
MLRSRSAVARRCASPSRRTTIERTSHRRAARGLRGPPVARGRQRKGLRFARWSSMVQIIAAELGLLAHWLARSVVLGERDEGEVGPHHAALVGAGRHLAPDEVAVAGLKRPSDRVPERSRVLFARSLEGQGAAGPVAPAADRDDGRARAWIHFDRAANGRHRGRPEPKASLRCGGGQLRVRRHPTTRRPSRETGSWTARRPPKSM